MVLKGRVGLTRLLPVTAKAQLEAAAKRHRDAVAFGYVSGISCSMRLSPRTKLTQ